MSSWHSYPSIFNLGHKAIADLLLGPVQVEEKIDGSQFSFGLIPQLAERLDEQDWFELKVRSKGAVMHADAPEKMFAAGVEHVKSIQHLLHPGWTYRGEYLGKPKHNALAYDRIPKGHVIIFDVNTGEEEYLSYVEKHAEAARLGLECVPLLFQGVVPNIESFRQFLDTTSCLGGQKIEGVVVKPIGYGLYGRDKKVLLGKFVSEAFKEVHRVEWGQHTRGNALDAVIASLATPARWGKAVIHLRERGLLTDTPKDIGMLINEVKQDILKEEGEWLRERIFKEYEGDVLRGCIRGLPEWYKEQLLKLQFERPEPSELDSLGGAVGDNHPTREAVLVPDVDSSDERD
jgi:hypothetical protein